MAGSSLFKIAADKSSAKPWVNDPTNEEQPDSISSALNTASTRRKDHEFMLELDFVREHLQ